MGVMDKQQFRKGVTYLVVLLLQVLSLAGVRPQVLNLHPSLLDPMETGKKSETLFLTNRDNKDNQLCH